MNPADLKFGIDDLATIAVRIRVPDAFFLRDIYPPASKGLAVLLTNLVGPALVASGLERANGAFVGAAANCQGIVNVSDASSALTALRSIFNRLLLPAPLVQLYIFDPRELVFRAVDPGNTEPLEYEQLNADMARWVEQFQAAGEVLKKMYPQ